MKTTTKKIVLTALLAAFACVATMVIKIPSPLNGYINLGDAIVLVSAWVLGPFYGFLASALGSALADVLSGYAIYAPATFLIKGAMALIASFLYIVLSRKIKGIFSRILSGLSAEAIMILGYYVFEGFLYGFSPSLVNIPANAIQGALGLIIGVILIKIFEKQHLI